MSYPNRNSRDHEAIVHEYEQLRPRYGRFTEKLAGLLRELLDAERIDYETVEARTKTVEQFADKITRPGKQYTDPLREVTDLSGLRVVVFYTEDVERVSELLEREFSIDRANSADSARALDPHEFGYRSVHYVVTLGEKRRELVEWSPFKEFSAEIQMRTVLQHAWASVSRAFDYTREAEIPSALRRRLFRLAGLFELADEEFSAIRAAHAVETKKIASSLGRGERDVELSLDSVREYLGRSEYFGELERVSRQLGFEIGREDQWDFTPSLVTYARHLGLQSITDLAKAVEPPIHVAEEYLGALLASSKDTWIVGIPFLAALMLIKFDPAKLNASYLLAQDGWDQSIAERVLGVVTGRGRAGHQRLSRRRRAS